MQVATKRDAIIKKLYNRYKTNGFITEDEALDCFVAHKIPLTHIDSITDQLLSIGIIIKMDENEDDNEDDAYDRTRTDYESIFAEVLQIAPGLNLLINYIKNIKPPQHREWHILIPQAQNGNRYANDRVFEMYLRVVLKIALKYHKESGYEIEDIIQVGAMGLLQAIKSYDFSKHGSFVSYMPFWITQHISRAIADLSRAIRIPVHMFETIRMVEQTCETLQYQSGTEPTISEIAAACNFMEDDIEEILEYKKDILYIEDFLVEDEDGFCSYGINDAGVFVIEGFVEKHDLRQILLHLIGTLSDREAEVLLFRFGFYDDVPKTLEEIGAVYGLTRERIRQIEKKAINRLRHHSRIKKLKGY